MGTLPGGGKNGVKTKTAHTQQIEWKLYGNLFYLNANFSYEMPI